MLDWVIVGGGIHGVTCASFLRARGVRSEYLTIIDPFESLLAVWKKSTEAVGVEQLRSSRVHHVDYHPYSLIRFSESSEGKQLGKLRGKYGHPDLHLFNVHCDRTVEKFSLDSSHLRDKITGLEKVDQNWRIERKGGSPLYAKNVVLAIGCDGAYPEWFQGEIAKDERIQLGFEAEPLQLESEEKMLIVGGGMSGVQIALRYAVQYPGQITLLSRRTPTVSLFDSDPGWIGPKLQESFLKIRSAKVRRECIKDARRPGSVPPKLFSSFKKFLREDSLAFIEGELEGVLSKKDEISAVLRRSGSEESKEYPFHRIFLATGFSSQCPQRELLHRIAKQEDLPLSDCGFPIPRSKTHWGKGLHLSGALAELQVGPVARNIVGARIAGEALVST